MKGSFEINKEKLKITSALMNGMKRLLVVLKILTIPQTKLSLSITNFSFSFAEANYQFVQSQRWR